MEACSELNDPKFRDWVDTTWGIHVERVVSGAKIQGSPERSLSRAVFEDQAGQWFLLEKFSREKWEVRARVNRVLFHLARSGLSRALAPEMPGSGDVLPFFGTEAFQVTRFLDSTELRRPQWLSSPEIGDEMAGFLVEMRRSSGRILREFSFPAFSLKAYIYKLFRDMAAHHPQAYQRYLPVRRFLEQGFMDAHDRLALAFCHGDFHPLNVIWDNPRIRAVIDWEFTGAKPDYYDAANLVGCAGIEHPEGLAMPMVTTFLSRIRAAGIVETWRWFPEYVLALRFAWLSEWLRKQDREMLETEAAFMDILIRHMDDLRDIWQTEQ